MPEWKERIPAPARWPLAYAGTLALCALVGLPTPLGFGNAVFLAGVAALAWSLTHIRLGGSKTMTGRDMHGKPIYTVDAPQRKAEIRRGLAVFAFAMALWAPLAVMALAF
jgi:hypothetical protein